MANDDFPTDFPEDEAGTGALRWASGILAATALGLALFNAGAIAGWADDLTMSPCTARVAIAAHAWDGSMASLNLDVPHTSLHQIWTHAEALRWPERNDRAAPLREAMR